jgi:hypothetical protein
MKTQKIVINTCYGGFSLSNAALAYLALKGIDVINLDRSNPHLIEIMESLGEKAFGTFAELKVVEIPPEVEYTIEENGGVEWIAERHRTWR